MDAFKPPFAPPPFFLALSDFVGQTSAAATGVASINVNDAGKYFCQDPKHSLSCANGLVHVQPRALFGTHTHAFSPAIDSTLHT